MWTSTRRLLLSIAAALVLAGCGPAARQSAALGSENQQVVDTSLKDLYMAVSAAPPHSSQQQKLLLKMAHAASNGKELFLVMRAAEGVFPPGAAAAPNEVYAIVTSKMMQFATLDQMTDFALQYPVAPEQTRSFVERMFQLGGSVSDARAWYRIKAAAYHLKVTDLERQAQARGDELAAR